MKNEEIEKNEEEQKELEQTEIDIDIDQDNVTREINLDDLYDGAVNSTVIIDPISNSETLMQPKKNNYTFLGLILAILVLLTLYYINNKTDLIHHENKVKTTTTTITTKKVTDKGMLSCTYTSKSDAETEEVTYTANYISDKVTNSEFNFVVVSNTEGTSAVIDDLSGQYETLYLNNVSVAGNNVSYNKNSKGFTFNIKTDYQKSDFDKLVITEGQNILYVKPSSDDTIQTLQKKYSDKGYTCNITYDDKD